MGTSLNTVNNNLDKITIGLVGKYVSLQDAYLSVVESLKHAGYPLKKDVVVKWIDSSEVTDDNVESYLSDVDGILSTWWFRFPC